MKRTGLIILTFLAFQAVVFSQGCLPDGIIFNYQYQIDDFQTMYPGCTEIEGDVFINSTGVLNLEGLSVIKKIGGYFKLFNTVLTDFTGLDSLTSIGGYFELHQNGLTSFQGLESLTSIGGYFDIYNNNYLFSMQGLNSLDSIGGFLWIDNNNSLISLVGIDNVSYIGSYLKINNNSNLSVCHVASVCDFISNQTGTVTIVYNADGCEYTAQVEEACEELSSCLPMGITMYDQYEIDNFALLHPNCADVEGYIGIQGNSISNLNGLSSINKINGSLLIYNNSTIPDLSGLENIEHLGGLFFENCELVQDFAELTSLEYVGASIHIEECDGFTSLSGLEGLQDINFRLILRNNPSLESLNGLNNIDSINDYALIQFNESLENIDAIHNIHSVANFKIEGNTNLTQLPDFINLDTIDGDLVIGKNSLTSLSGFNNLTTINGALELLENNFMSDLSALENLTSVGEKLYIYEFDELESLSGLENLTSINGNIWITKNDNLNNIYGINNIDPASISGLMITDNPSLSHCDAESICNYLVSPNGFVSIHDNSEGCNSDEEVEEACWSGIISKHNDLEEMQLFPNPANKIFSISQPEKDQLIKAELFDYTGRRIHIKEVLDNTYDISSLNPGIYMVKINSGTIIIFRTLVIQ